MNNYRYYYSRESDEIQRQNFIDAYIMAFYDLRNQTQYRIDKLEALSSKCLNKSMDCMCDVWDLKKEIEKMEDLMKKYESLEDKYSMLHHQIEDELNRLVPGRKERLEREEEERKKHRGEDDLPF